MDLNYETSIKGIYAISDVNGISMVAHAALHQGEHVTHHIMGDNSANVDNIIPSCIFIFPEVACVGVTEDEAKATGLNYKISKFIFGANGKDVTLGEGEGFIKLIPTNNLTEDKNDNALIGAHIMGPHASDLIHECTLAYF